MSIKIFRDEDILDEGFRSKIIQEIEGVENQQRKAEAFRRYEVFRDIVSKYVMMKLRSQGFKEETLAVMQARAANISICKKIVKKKSRAYSAGVDRTIPGDVEGTMSINFLEDYLCTTEVFKKSDEYVNLSNNALIYVHPIVDSYDDEDMPIVKLSDRTLHPHLFDVIPDAQAPEKARAVVLSDFPAGMIPQGFRPTTSNWNGVRDGSGQASVPGNPMNAQGDGVDQEIANSPSDKGASNRLYVWWTNKFHFTTNSKGKIVPGMQEPDLANPIKKLPFITTAKNQDGSYWGQGGDDIIEGSILVNLFLTDAASILNMQGWGQPVLTGKKLKGDYRVGPQNVLELSYEDGEVAPDFKIISTDPHTADWISALEVYLAMLLTTNNLSTKNIQGSLDANSTASGIAKMVDESESVDDLQEAQAYFSNKETDYWVIVQRWLDAYRDTNTLDPALESLPEFDGTQVNTKFKFQNMVLSEQDRLNILITRRELGINTMLDLLKMDDPTLTDAEAQEKLKQISQDQLLQQLNTTSPISKGTLSSQNTGDPIIGIK